MHLIIPAIRTIARVALFAVFIPAMAWPALGAVPASGQRGDAAKLPVALRPTLYRSLAKDADYQIGKTGCVTLPKQGVNACFNAEGANFTGAATSLSLHLVASGRGVDLASVTPTRPEMSGNRVSYRHGNLSEWWRVLPVGFEQGFTVTKRPAGQGELTLALTASAKATRHGGTLGWGKLRYGKLVVTDANGKVIPATLKNDGNRILITVNDVYAVYPLTVDPLVWLEQKVTASDGKALDGLGDAVSISGTTAFIGAPFAAVNGRTGQGAVYVFTESNGVWSQTQKLTASDGVALDNFGTAVALSGTTAFIGAPRVTLQGNTFEGAAYVFTESNGVWSQAQKLTASDGAAFDNFGVRIALDGPTALVDASLATVNGQFQEGAVYAFARSDGVWSQTQKLTASDGAASDFFGRGIALDGATAVLSSPGADVNGHTDQGAAYVFTESGGVWSQAQRLAADDGVAQDKFGWSVAVSGATALVGAICTPFDPNGDRCGPGAVYEFIHSGGIWNQTQKLTADDGVMNDEFGNSVSFDGPIALIGAAGSDSQTGAAYIFTKSGGTWTQTQKLFPGDQPPSGLFGVAVALSGKTALVGAENATVNGNVSQGAAYFYGESDLDLAVSAPETVGQGQQYVSQTIATNSASAVSPAVTATLTVPAAASFVSATASQGSCGEDSGIVTCDFGQIEGNAGTASADVTLKATGGVGETIGNTASITKARPPLAADAETTISASGACPAGYSEQDGNLNAGQRAHSPIYRAPAGEENAILTGPSGFQLYAVFQNAQGRKVFRIPGNEVHRRAPAGTYTWVVKAGASGGAYTLCVRHP